MKKLVALFILMSVFAIFLSSCSYPSMEQWYIYAVKRYEVFSNGQTQYKDIGATFHEISPWIVDNEMTYIDFKWNGEVIFKPYDSDEVLVGKYEHDLSGKLQIIFENGESVEYGSARFSYILGGPTLPEYEAYVKFTFRGIYYRFGIENGAQSENYYDKMEEFAQRIRNNDKGLLQKGYVNNGKLKYDTETWTIDLFEEGYVRVTAVKVTSDNKITVLDYIPNGECYFYRDAVQCVMYFIE